MSAAASEAGSTKFPLEEPEVAADGGLPGPKPADVRCPYPGLRSFTQSESTIFFGRRAQAGQLREILAARNLLVVLGGSGSGKSSLVRAGLLPTLNSTDPIPNRFGAWYVVEFRPKTDPTAEFLDAVYDQIFDRLIASPSTPASEDSSSQYPSTARDADRIDCYCRAVSAALALDPPLTRDEPCADRERRSRWRLREMLLKGDVVDNGAVFDFADKSLPTLDRELAGRDPRAGSTNLLLLIDQFEEVFSLPPDRQQSGLDTVMTLLTSVQRFQPPNLFTIITMRNEWLHRCGEYSGVAEAMNGSTYLVDLIGESEVETVIVEPARSVLRLNGLEYGPRPAPYTREVVDRLRAAFTSKAGLTYAGDQLPLLQHLLPLLWDRAVQDVSALHASDFTVTLEHLHAVVPEPEWSDGAPLPACLNLHAERVLDRAIKTVKDSALAIDENVARNLIQVAFSSLAIQDDKGIIRRRFATLDEMLANVGFIERNPSTVDACRAALAKALACFASESLISSNGTGGETIYDINHEALVRNWNRYLDWVKKARAAREWVGEIFKAVGSAPKRSQGSDWITRAEELFTASNLRSASEFVDKHTNMFAELTGLESLFSTRWVRQTALASNTVDAERFPEHWAEVKHKVADAKKYHQSLWNRYRVVATVLSLSIGFFVTLSVVFALFLGITSESLKEKDRLSADANMITQILTTPLEYSKKKLLTVEDQILDYTIIKNSYDQTASEGVHPKLRTAARITAKSTDAAFRNRMSRTLHIFIHDSQAIGNFFKSDEDDYASCIGGGDKELLSNRKNLGWRYQDVGGSMLAGWFPAWRDPENKTRIESNLTGDNWTKGSIVCTSPDGNWQFIWLNNSDDEPDPTNFRGYPQAMPHVRNIAWIKRPSEVPGRETAYVLVGEGRIFADNNSHSLYPTLYSSFDSISKNVHSQGRHQRTIKFLVRGHWVGFSVELKNGKTAILWTTTGLGDPEEVTERKNIAMPEWKACKIERGEQRCFFEYIRQTNVQYRPFLEWGYRKYSECRQAGEICPVSFGLQYTDESQDSESLVRVSIDRYAMTDVKSGGYSDGYYWLKDSGGQVWRYLIDPDKLLNVHYEMWKNIKIPLSSLSKACEKLRCLDRIPPETRRDMGTK